MKIVTMVFIALSLTLNVAQARGKEPCSGSKGGVASCSKGKFICKDGSISQSKKVCNASSKAKIKFAD